MTDQTTGFRFSYNIFTVDALPAFAETCRRAERLGYDVVFAADHLGIPAPFPALVAAASATERLRVGTLVLNASFWNPELLAREIATVDVLTGGRLEVGLGAGHMKWEYEAAGIPWQPFGARVEHLAATIEQLRRRFAAEHGYPQQAEQHERYGVPVLRPTQRRGFGGYGPPLLVGGTAERVLTVAGRHADIVGLAGLVQLKGQPPGTFRVATAEETDERVSIARRAAGDRADRLEWQALLQRVVTTDDRRAAARTIAERFDGLLTAEQVLDSPFLLIGTVEEMADQLLARRERYGITHYSVHQPFLEAFAPVIARVRKLTGATPGGAPGQAPGEAPAGA